MSEPGAFSALKPEYRVLLVLAQNPIIPKIRFVMIFIDTIAMQWKLYASNHIPSNPCRLELHRVELS